MSENFPILPCQSTSSVARMCSKCIYDESLSGIFFDQDGICNYCKQITNLKDYYQETQAAGQSRLSELLKEIKRKGRNRPYDCVIGVSGGTDSSYMLLKAVEWGLRPLAVHYDNTWNSGISSQNIYKVTEQLGVPLVTYVVDCKEVDDIKRSFLLAGVREFDADTDIAFVQVLRMVAAKNAVKYIFEGHSFLTEGLTPVGDNYLDGGYVRDVHRKFGRFKMKTFPNMTFFEFIKWILIYRQKFIRPLWYLNYDKKEARQELTRKVGWTYYGGHHLENYSSNFAHTVWLPRKFKIDYRILTLAADVREGRIKREDAIKLFHTPIPPQDDLIRYTISRLQISMEEFDSILSGPSRTWKEFKTYKSRFEKLHFFFFVCAKFNLVPMSFYVKYCKKATE